MVNFTTVACRISSRLKWHKNCKNPLRLAKVIVKNRMSRFLWFTVYIYQPPCRTNQPPAVNWTGKEYQPKCGDAGVAHSICGCTCGWQVKLCDPSFKRAIPQRRGELLSIRCYINFMLIYFLWRDLWAHEVSGRNKSRGEYQRFPVHFLASVSLTRHSSQFLNHKRWALAIKITVRRSPFQFLPSSFFPCSPFSRSPA